jgi:hypothetical protein
MRILNWVPMTDDDWDWVNGIPPKTLTQPKS